MTHRSEADLIEHSHNTARFFVENRQVSLILLIGVIVWGWYGYRMMPKRKDPSIPIRVAVASTSWPGATAQEVEQLVTRPIEQVMAQNSFIRPPAPSEFGIRSISFPGLSLVYVQLDDIDSQCTTYFGRELAAPSLERSFYVNTWFGRPLKLVQTLEPSVAALGIRDLD